MIVPPGFGTVVPYIFAEEWDAYVAFLIAAFGAVEVGRSMRGDGGIANVQLRFGGTTIMLSDVSAVYPASRVSLYLYVDDADAAMARALAAGGHCEMAVGDMPYGDRQGGIRDPRGNIWWVSQRLTDEPYF
ncbi:VOC family protein [Sphingomonas arantia]|uniref:VOC family protein n=1 Tax=Sphingomonas arantia TaxID=1460676 RepID=A0ABW4TXG9_9SPHN